MGRMTLGERLKFDRKDQEFRQRKKFPKDRIAFRSVKQTVVEDQKDFKEYFDGVIDFDTLRARIAKNNLLDEYFEDGMIPTAMMRNTLKITGWTRRHGSE